MKRIPWTYVLPLLNAALAGMLLYLGERKKLVFFADKMSAWDYIAPATQTAYMINFPAYTLWFVTHRMLPSDSLGQNGSFLLLTVALWYLIGVCVTSRGSLPGLTFSRRARVCVIYPVVIAVAAMVGILALSELMLYPLLAFAGLCWCAGSTWWLVFMIHRANKRERVSDVVGF